MRYARTMAMPPAGTLTVVEFMTPPDGIKIEDCFAPGLTFVACPDPAVQVGWTYDGTAFDAPAPPVTPSMPTQIAPLAFEGRFTSAELGGIFGASQSTPALTQWLWRTAAAQFVDLADPQTAQGLADLVAAGLLTAARQTEILTP
jgi:hypothetical protein